MGSSLFSLRHQLGYDLLDHSCIGLIRSFEFVHRPGRRKRFFIDVHCLQFGRKYTVRLSPHEIGRIVRHPIRSLTLNELQENLEQCRVHLLEAMDFFGSSDPYIEELEREHQDILSDLEKIMRANGIYTPFDYEFLLAQHFLSQIAQDIG